jgi:hypothetical protein
MKAEEKTLCFAVAGALFLLWFFKPKGGFKTGSSDSEEHKYTEPQVSMDGIHDAKENADTGIRAMREAINAGEPKRKLDELKTIISKEYGVTIMANKQTGKLRAMSKEGKVLLEEK